MNRHKSLFALIGVALFCCAGLPAYGASPSKLRVTIPESGSVEGNQLKPGDYTVIVKNHQATFKLGGRDVATVPCSWKQLNAKAQDSAVLTTSNAITELQFAGKREALDFSGARHSGSAR